VRSGEETVTTHRLAIYDEQHGHNETEAFVVKAPEQLGQYVWKIVFPNQQIVDAVYQESELPFYFKTKPQSTSLAVWAVPSPVLQGSQFKVKVGVKSTWAYALKGALIEILDESGTRAGGGALGDSPWPGTSALYWAEIELIAPRSEGVYSWSARFAARELALPHDGACGKFSFAITAPPQHTVTVKVVVKETEEPLAHARVRVGVFQCTTDATGSALLQIPNGLHRLTAWSPGYEASSRIVEIAGDTVLQIEQVPLPQRDPYAEWMMPV
jgi:hypothetical protein